VEEAVRAKLAAAERAVQQQSKHRKSRRRYARALIAAGDPESADALLRSSLPPRQRRSIEAGIRAMFTERIGVSPDTCSSRFLAGGQSNIAFIRHDSTPLGPLCTKVVGLWRPFGRQEVAINRALMTADGPWRTVTPRVYDVRVDPTTQLALITSEFFAGKRLPPGQGFAQLLGLLASFASPPAAEQLRAALQPHERPGKPSWLDRSLREWPRIGGIYVLQPHKVGIRLFRWLDTRFGSLLLFSWMQRQIRNLLPHHHRHAQEIADKWERHTSWRAIDPKRDYTLAHGDYGSHNVMFDADQNRSTVIDFNSLMAAPATIDLAHILYHHPYGGEFMQNCALPQLHTHAPDWLWSPPQRLLFLTLLLAYKLWFVRPPLLRDPEEDIEPLLVALSDAIGAG
jgi:hypothetical protein